MTQPLLGLSARLVQFEQQISQFESKVHKLASSSYSVEKIATTTIEYEKFIDEVKNFEQDFQNSIGTIAETFKKALLSQFTSLQVSCSNVQEKLLRGADASLINYKLDSLFKQYTNVSLSEEKERLYKLEQLKERSLKILSSPKLSPAITPVQLTKVIHLCNLIEEYQYSELSRSLQEMDRLIKQAIQCPEEHRKERLKPIQNIFNDLCSYKLGFETRTNICEQISIEAGKPIRNGGWSWGFHHAFDDLEKLSKIISSQPQFSVQVKQTAEVHSDYKQNDTGEQT